MSNLRQAAQQALEAWFRPHGINYVDFKPYMEALKQALAEPEQEPVRLQCTTCGTVYADGVPPQVPEQEPQTTHWEGCEAVHPECRKQEQEPVAHIGNEGQVMWFKKPAYQSMLYTAPTPRKPLTDEEMRECAQAMNAEPLAEGWPELIKFARAIERAHGIGEQHE